MTAYEQTGTEIPDSELGVGSEDRVFQTDLGWWWQTVATGECGGPFDSEEAARQEYSLVHTPALKTYDIYLCENRKGATEQFVGQVEAVGEMEAMQVAEHEFAEQAASYKAGVSFNAVEHVD